MNRQKNFRNPKYNHGQHDKYEGAILRGPCDVKYFEGGKEKQVHLNKYCICILYVRNRIYISWDYIKPLWDEDGLEMMIIKNTSVFLKKVFRSSR